VGRSNRAGGSESEKQKVRCGARHFDGALGVDFKLVASADELPGGAAVGG
jgi:hypothetical protein